MMLNLCGGKHVLDVIFSLKGEVFKVHGPRGYIKSSLVYYTLLQLAKCTSVSENIIPTLWGFNDHIAMAGMTSPFVNRIHTIDSLISAPCSRYPLCDRCSAPGVYRKKTPEIRKKQYLGVSKNTGTPKWMVYNEKPY